MILKNLGGKGTKTALIYHCAQWNIYNSDAPTPEGAKAPHG
jgi:hypothetical protein